MLEKRLWDVVKENTRDVALSTCTVVADNILAGIWLGGEYGFEHFVVPTFPVSSPMTTASLWGLRAIFASSTLIPTASRVWRNIRIRWLRDKAEVKNVENEIRAAQTGSSELKERPKGEAATGGDEKK